MVVPEPGKVNCGFSEPVSVLAKVWEKRRRAVGARINELRVENGLTQEQLAFKSGVSRNIIIDVEFGRRGLLYERLAADGPGPNS